MTDLQQIDIIINKCIQEVKNINPTIKLNISFYKEIRTISMDRAIDILEKYCILNNLDVNIVRSNSRKQEYTKIKQFISNYFTEEFNWTPFQIEELIKVERTSYYNAIKTFRDSCEMDKKYLLSYNSFKQIFNDLIDEKIVIGFNKYQSLLRPVIQYDFEMRKVNEFISIREAHRKTGISKGAITRSLKNSLQRKHTGRKYIWKYKYETPQIKVLSQTDNTNTKSLLM